MPRGAGPTSEATPRESLKNKPIHPPASAPGCLMCLSGNLGAVGVVRGRGLRHDVTTREGGCRQEGWSLGLLGWGAFITPELRCGL